MPNAACEVKSISFAIHVDESVFQPQFVRNINLTEPREVALNLTIEVRWRPEGRTNTLNSAIQSMPEFIAQKGRQKMHYTHFLK